MKITTNSNKTCKKLNKNTEINEEKNQIVQGVEERTFGARL